MSLFGRRVETPSEKCVSSSVLHYVHRDRTGLWGTSTSTFTQLLSSERWFFFFHGLPVPNKPYVYVDVKHHERRRTTFQNSLLLTSTETVRVCQGRGAQDGHLDFHTAPELLNVVLSFFLSFFLAWCLLITSTETTSLIRDGRRWGKRKIIYLSLHCHNKNESCIKMGSDESHFNVSLVLRYKATRQSPQTTTFLKRKESRSGIELFCLPA